MARRKRHPRWQTPDHGTFVDLGVSTLIEIQRFRSQRMTITVGEHGAIVAPHKLVSYEALFDRSVVFHAAGGDILLGWDFPTNEVAYDLAGELDDLDYGDAVDAVEDAAFEHKPWAKLHGDTPAGLQAWLNQKVDSSWAEDWFPHHPFERLPGFEIFDGLKPAIRKQLGLLENSFAEGPCVTMTCTSAELQSAIDRAGLPFRVETELLQ